MEPVKSVTNHKYVVLSSFTCNVVVCQFHLEVWFERDHSLSNIICGVCAYVYIYTRTSRKMG